jgi:hypothetical protein
VSTTASGVGVAVGSVAVTVPLLPERKPITKSAAANTTTTMSNRLVIFYPPRFQDPSVQQGISF